jgi:hypothetical protein
MYGLLILYFPNVLSLYYVVVIFLLFSGSSNSVVVTELLNCCVCDYCLLSTLPMVVPVAPGMVVFNGCLVYKTNFSNYYLFVTVPGVTAYLAFPLPVYTERTLCYRDQPPPSWRLSSPHCMVPYTVH